MTGYEQKIRNFADIADVHALCSRWLEKERRHSRLTMAEAARACGYSERKYRKLLNSPRHMALIASALSRACGMTVSIRIRVASPVDAELPDEEPSHYLPMQIHNAEQFGAHRAERLAGVLSRHAKESLRMYVRRLYEIDAVDMQYHPDLSRQIERFKSNHADDAHWHEYWAGFMTRVALIGIRSR